MIKKITDLYGKLTQSIYSDEKLEKNTKMLSVVSFALAVAMAVFLFINIASGLAFSAVCSGTMAAIFLGASVLCLRDKRRAASVLLVVGLCFACTLYTVRGTSEGFAILWCVLIPISIMYFINVLKGIVTGIYFLLLITACFLTPVKELLSCYYTDLFMQRFPLFYLVTLFLSSVIMIQYHLNSLAQIESESLLKERLSEREVDVERELAYNKNLSTEGLAAITNCLDARHHGTAGHSEKVAEYSLRLAQGLGWSTKRCSELKLGALLHDIGNLGISDRVLDSTGIYTAKEREVMKMHTIIGDEILSGMSSFPTVHSIARSHHERWDGKGYPDGLSHESIPEEARIVAIAEAFDSMKSTRPYRPALSDSQILKELEDGKGSQFDPEYTDIFITLWKAGEL